MSGFGAEGVAVDEREKWFQANLSVPGAADMTAVDAVAILDSGSGITTMSVEIANKLQAAFPDVQVLESMSHPRKLKVANGRVLAVEKQTCPVGIALHTSWGLVDHPGSVLLRCHARGRRCYHSRQPNVEASRHRHW